MKKQQFIDMQELGTSSIPNLLLTNYQQLGLNETELVLLLKIKMHLEKGSFFSNAKRTAGRHVYFCGRVHEQIENVYSKGISFHRRMRRCKWN